MLLYGTSIYIYYRDRHVLFISVVTGDLLPPQGCMMISLLPVRSWLASSSSVMDDLRIFVVNVVVVVAVVSGGGY